MNDHDLSKKNRANNRVSWCFRENIFQRICITEIVKISISSGIISMQRSIFIVINALDS